MAGPVTELQTTKLRKEHIKSICPQIRVNNRRCHRKKMWNCTQNNRRNPQVESPTRVTRAGRAINTPAKFEDFIKL